MKLSTLLESDGSNLRIEVLNVQSALIENPHNVKLDIQVKKLNNSAYDLLVTYKSHRATVSLSKSDIDGELYIATNNMYDSEEYDANMLPNFIDAAVRLLINDSGELTKTQESDLSNEFDAWCLTSRRPNIVPPFDYDYTDVVHFMHEMEDKGKLYGLLEPAGHMDVALKELAENFLLKKLKET